MVAQTRTRPTPTEQESRGVNWLFIGLAVSCLALLFQIFPQLWWSIWSVIDVRHWGWGSYAVASSVAIAWLVYLKMAMENE